MIPIRSKGDGASVVAKGRRYQLAYSLQTGKYTISRSFTYQWSPESKSLSRWSIRTIPMSEDMNMKWRKLWVATFVTLTCPHFPHTDHTTFWSCLVSKIPAAGAVGMWETPEANAEAFSKAVLSPSFP